MKTCPKCGVENLQTAASCHRCAVPLEGPEDLMGIRADMPFSDQLPPTIMVSGREPEQHHGPSSEYAGHIICPNCEVANEPDWLFCQECGMKLSRPPAGSSDSPAQDSSLSRPSALPSSVVANDFQDKPQPDPGKIRFEQKPPPAFDTKPEDPVVIPQVTDPTTEKVAQREPFASNVRQPATDRPAAQGERKRMTTNVVCTTCGTIQTGEGFFCTSCGAKLSSVAMERLKEREAAQPVEPARVTPNLVQIMDGGEVGETYSLDREKVTIGRSRADITFPHDGFMSGLHARIVERGGRYFLVDENSRNGTFVRINKEIELRTGDTIIVGKQVFKFEQR